MHEPLKWLANLKLKGMLGRWALALQEYSFSVVYCRGSQNTNADALSKWRDPTLPAAVTRADIQTPLSCILAAQKQDQVIKLAGRSGIEIVKLPCNHQLAKAAFEKIYSQLWAHAGWQCVEALYTWTNFRCCNSASSSSITLQKEALQ